MGGKPVATISQFQEHIEIACAANVTEVDIGFATITKASMHPQLGIPQLYHDQLNIISDHLWDLRYDLEWHAAAKDALPILEVIQKEGTYENLPEQDKHKLQDVLLKAASVKKENSLVVSSRICPIGMTGNSLNSNNWTNTMIKIHLVNLNHVPKVLTFYNYYSVILLKMMIERRPTVSVMETKTAAVLLPLQKHMQHLWKRQHLMSSGLQLLSTILSR